VRRLVLAVCLVGACGSGHPINDDGGVDDRPAVDHAIDRADTADVPGDVGGDVPGDVGGTNADGGTHPYVYMAMASTALMLEAYYPTDIVMVDVAAGRAVLDTTLMGTVAMVYQEGKLLVARGSGNACVSVLNADTLAVERTQMLPWDPIAAVFSSDGKYLYASHGNGYLSQVRMADGAVTADLFVPLPAQVDVNVDDGIGNVAISPSQKLLGTTTSYSGEGTGVGLIEISGETLSLAHQWFNLPTADATCLPGFSSLRFDHTNRWLSVFDSQCGSIDIYDVVAGELTPGGSVKLADVTGGPPFIGTAEDSSGRFWAIGYQWLYWIDPTAPAQHGVFPIGDAPGDSPAGILLNDPARTLYLWNNPRVEGVFTIDPSTGNRTKLPWNLDLFSEQAIAAQGIWVERGAAIHGDGGGADATDAQTDAPPDAAADGAFDAPGDGPNTDGGTRPYLYLATVSTALRSENDYPTDIVIVDVAAGRAVLDTTLLGALAVTYRDGKLLVARGAGYTRVSILNADTLAVERTQVLPWDPTAAVFSRDGSYLYAVHGDGYIAQVRMADGVVTADLLLPVPAQFANDDKQSFDIALSPSQKLLATTALHSGEGSSVRLVTIDGETLSPAHEWISQPFAESNCGRFAQNPVFDHTSRWLVTFDQNCGAVDVYDMVAGDLTPGGSVILNPSRVGGFAAGVEDALGRFWAAGDMTLYWIDPADPGQHGTFPFADGGGLVTNDPARALYVWGENTWVDGVFTIDPATGAATQLPWNLDLIARQVLLSQPIWVER